jgi:hypothetical protein
MELRQRPHRPPQHQDPSCKESASLPWLLSIQSTVICWICESPERKYPTSLHGEVITFTHFPIISHHLRANVMPCLNFFHVRVGPAYPFLYCTSSIDPSTPFFCLQRHFLNPRLPF